VERTKSVNVCDSKWRPGRPQSSDQILALEGGPTLKKKVWKKTIRRVHKNEGYHGTPKEENRNGRAPNLTTT